MVSGFCTCREQARLDLSLDEKASWLDLAKRQKLANDPADAERKIK
jgi:hypothetical protein